MNKDQKAGLTGEIKELLDDSNAIYFTDFTGLTVAEVNELRDEFHKAKLVYKVVKNTLTSRALSQTDKYSDHRDKLNDYLKGPTGIIFATGDPVSPAKIIKKKFDKIEKPKLKVAIVENELYDSKSLNQLASLLSKDELIAGILGCLNSPASGVVASVNGVMRDLFSVIEEVAKKKAA